MYSTCIIADSLNVEGSRCTTFQVTLPRFELPSLNTHRVLSKNSASNRARPSKFVIKQVRENPFVPEYWPLNEPGMQGYTELSLEHAELAKQIWLESAEFECRQVERLLELNVHKGTANRLVEAFQWHTVIVTGTEWANFFGLRCHHAAQFEIRKIATMMRDLYYSSKPVQLQTGDWHLPYLLESENDLDIETKKKICVARCARVSYKNFDGNVNLQKDIELFDKLCVAEPLHASPAEHIAQAMLDRNNYANFIGFRQLRSDLPNETIRSYDPAKD